MRQRAAIMWEFASRICAGPSLADRGCRNSSPVENTATRGRLATATRAFPTVARSPTPAGDTRMPASRSFAPLRTSAPRAVTRLPGSTGGGFRPGAGQTTKSPSRIVSSTMIAASAPSGSGAPVMTAAASPAPNRTFGIVPAGI